ncbi:MAG: hypothetical protein ABR558_10130 [Thioalkalivibrio sp.]
MKGITPINTLKLLTLPALLALALMAGCSDSGPAEETGEAIDDAVQDAQDAISPPGPAEEAGREIDEAVDRATGN